MAIECTPEVQAARIANGATRSDPIFIDTSKFFGLERPEPWQDDPADDTAEINFTVEVSAAGHAGWKPLYNEEGDEISIPTGTVVDTGRAVGLDAFAVAMAPFRWVRFVASEAPDADRWLNLHTKD